MTDVAGEPWNTLLGRALEHALDYREGLRERPVAPDATLLEVAAVLDPQGCMPKAGRAPLEVLEELVSVAGPGLSASSGPRFFGWVTGGTVPASVAADWMTSVWDQNAGPAGGAPAACAFELVALRWIIELLRLPDSVQGALVTGASAANFSALAGARTRVLAAAGWDLERDGLCGAPAPKILVGCERHDSIDKALRLLGFGKRALVIVGADSEGRISASALRKALTGLSGPVIVCAQAGNVNSGAFDPLTELCDAIGEYRGRHGEALAWLHVDGAFGMWARASERLEHLTAGLELADSWATDAHKFLNVPYDSGIVLTRHPRDHRRAFAVTAPYLRSGTAQAGFTPSAFTPELSRRARGFALWAALRQLGRQGLDDLVTRSAGLARSLATQLSDTPGLRVQNDVVFNQVVVGATAPRGADAAAFIDELTRGVQADGTCYATPTNWRGQPALRFSVINAETHDEDIRLAASAVKRVYAELINRA